MIYVKCPVDDNGLRAGMNKVIEGFCAGFDAYAIIDKISDASIGFEEITEEEYFQKKVQLLGIIDEPTA